MAQAVERLYEQVLVVRCQAGDDEAFAELVQHYHRRLWYYVRRLLGPGREPDDVLQNVWLAVYRKLSTLDSPRAFKVWLYRIARNAALTELRARHDWAELVEQAVAADTHVDDALIAKEQAARIHAVLETLRPEYREILTLRFVEDMSYEEIASVIGCRLGTVRSRLHYAKLLLKTRLRG